MPRPPSHICFLKRRLTMLYAMEVPPPHMPLECLWKLSAFGAAGVLALTQSTDTSIFPTKPPPLISSSLAGCWPGRPQLLPIFFTANCPPFLIPDSSHSSVLWGLSRFLLVPCAAFRCSAGFLRTCCFLRFSVHAPIGMALCRELIWNRGDFGKLVCTSSK